MVRFHVTYDIVTPESAAHADVAERGFIHPDGYAEILPDGVHGNPAQILKDTCGMRLRQALDLIGLVADGGSGTSYYEMDVRNNYRDGSEESRAFHLPDNATASSIARVARLLEKLRLLSR